MKKAITRTGLIVFLVFILGMPSLASLSFGMNSCGGDSPRDAPKEKLGIPTASSQQLGSSSSGTEFSPSSDDDPWVKFKVNEGWDLDQYLFKESSPIDFFIDIDDFALDPNFTYTTLPLTLAVWDVDYYAPVEPPERDLVKINGHPLGYLTGANGQWSTVTFYVYPSFMVEGSNHIQVFIDELGDDWAVEVDWAELKIPFNIKVTKIEITEDIDIKKGTTDVLITGPIWEKRFDASGKLIDVPGVGGDTKRDYPIADWFKNNKFKVKITVDAWPKKPPKLNPFIFVYGWTEAWYKERLPGIGVTLHDFSGWEGEYEFDKLPQKVLKTYFEQEFAFLAGPGHIADPQFTTHTLYITYDEPKDNPLANVNDIKRPKEKWLDVATSWAKDAKTDEEVVSKTTRSITYIPKWTYKGHGPFDYVYGVELVEETKNYGSCGSFKEVLQILSGVLGVVVEEEPIEKDLPFLTVPLTALDGNTGNAYENGKNWAQRDRWVFHDHVVGKYKDKYYDPTFRDNIGFVDINKNIYAWGKAEDNGPPPHIDLERGANKAELYREAATNQEEQKWGKWRYKLNTNKMLFEECAPVIMTESIGNFSDYGWDTDSDGLYNLLVVEAWVNIAQAGNYSILGVLHFNGTYISLETQDTCLDTGNQHIRLCFYGEDIYDNLKDGNYNVELHLFDKDGSETGTGSFNTSYYTHTEFQRLALEIVSITDCGRDTDSNSLYNYLTVKLDLNIVRAGNFSMSGILLSNGTYIASVFNSTYLDAGPKTMYFSFDGPVIHSSRANGPYTLKIMLSDGIHGKIETRNTSTYFYTQFESSTATFTGTYSDHGVDTDSDGLFNFLSLSIGVDASATGDYTVSGHLLDSTGEPVTFATNHTCLETGIHNISLSFDGADIFTHAMNGPYTIRDLQLLDSDGKIIDQIDPTYSTGAYSYTAFQRPKASFTGTYSDYGVDTDIGSTYARTYIPHGWIGGGTPMGWHGDDSCWPYTLPFNFPFYGTNYTTIYISSNGLITFLSPDSSYSNSISALAGKLAIAPAWDDWVTDEPNDIYMWQNSTHVGIRWYVRPYGSSIVANFETMLSMNGQIQFNYGYNNGTVSTTIGVSNGAGDILAEDVTNLNNINSIIFTSGDGLFNFLTIQAELNVTKPGNYMLEGALCDANGSLIVSTTTESYFSVGTRLFALDFDGVTICSHGVNGSYNLGSLRLYDENGSIIDADYNVYNTTMYNYTDFQRPVIELTGIFSDYGIDTDTDGFCNYLAVEIDVIVQYSGTYEVNARLTDINGNEIIWASNSTYLNKGTPQTIQLNFDGRYIFGNGVNGPYYVKDLSVYYSDIALYVSDVYTTSAYNYMQFQKSGIIVGTVTDEQAEPIPNALVYVSAVDYKYTNVNGSYKLIVLQTGTYTVEVIPPPELPLLGNSTTIHVTVGQTTILNFVLMGTHDIALTNVSPSKTVVGQGYSTNINVTVANQGDYTEAFNTTVYGDRFFDSFDVWNYTGAWRYYDPDATEGYVSLSDGLLHVSGYGPPYHDGGLTTIKEFNYPIAVETKFRSNSANHSPQLHFGSGIQPCYIATQYDEYSGGWHTGYADTTGFHDIVWGTSIDVGTWYTLRLLVNETNFKVYLDDVLRVDRDWLPPQEYPKTITLASTYGSYGSGDFDWVKIETIIGTKATTLPGGDSTIITFIWNTAGWAKGNYTISAYAWPVPGETETTDNMLSDGWVFVAMVGDVNGDNKVDVKDVYAVAKAFGTSKEGPNPPGRTYEPNCDINDDGKIDIKDYYIVCKHYGETDP